MLESDSWTKNYELEKELELIGKEFVFKWDIKEEERINYDHQDENVGWIGSEIDQDFFDEDVVQATQDKPSKNALMKEGYKPEEEYKKENPEIDPHQELIFDQDKNPGNDLKSNDDPDKDMFDQNQSPENDLKSKDDHDRELIFDQDLNPGNDLKTKDDFSQDIFDQDPDPENDLKSKDDVDQDIFDQDLDPGNDLKSKDDVDQDIFDQDPDPENDLKSKDDTDQELIFDQDLNPEINLESRNDPDQELIFEDKSSKEMAETQSEKECSNALISSILEDIILEIERHEKYFDSYEHEPSNKPSEFQHISPNLAEGNCKPMSEFNDGQKFVSTEILESEEIGLNLTKDGDIQLIMKEGETEENISESNTGLNETELVQISEDRKQHPCSVHQVS